MTVTRAYAGIGSRKTPPAALEMMRMIARQLAHEGYHLRSGGADGADSKFAQGAREAGGDRTIYLPWPGFNEVVDENAVAFDRLPGAAKAMQVAARFHPNWAGLHRRPAVRKLMARNVMQVLGEDCMSLSRFVICWAEDSEFDRRGQLCNVAGGTGQAVRIAYGHGIPVFNLALPGHEARIRRWLLPAGASGAPNRVAQPQQPCLADGEW